MSPIPAQKRKTRARRTNKRTVIIRMYNVGFGDCFLMTFPSDGGTRKVLFDCGTLASERPINEVARQVIRDVTDADGVPRIDVIVCSHRHKDHVSGFDDDAWRRVRVQEVWMPWTETPKDPEARRIRDVQSRLAGLLHRSLQARAAASGVEKERLEGLGLLALNALSNEGAMKTLHEGFAGKPKRRFLPGRTAEERMIETPALPGVKVHVLGPSRDKNVIRDMDPPIGQSYLRLEGSAAPAEAKSPDVFNENWWVSPAEYSWPNLVLSEEDRRKIQRVSADMEFAVAASLDKAVNGTSLMLIFQIQGTHLLFPGDAQWGTWQAALNVPESRELLKQTKFYKIGHHGSENATPVEFVEHTIGKDFWAMASTKAVSQWPNIPREPLLKALRRRTAKVARSDEANQAGNGFVVKGDSYIDAVIPI